MTHDALVVNMWTLPLSNIGPLFKKKIHIHDYRLENGKLGGGHQTLVVVGGDHQVL